LRRARFVKFYASKTPPRAPFARPRQNARPPPGAAGPKLST
jgi:hypothetical protein